jgi:DNA-binding NarL/FixJ family response regulator
MATFPIRIVIADDHAMVREALCRTLAQSGFEVVGQAGTVEQALDVLDATKPHVLVLDYSIPQGDAPEAMQAALKKHPRLKIVVLTVHQNIHYAVRVLEAGAFGFVVKSGAVSELVEAVKTAYEGEIFISPAVSQLVLQRLRQPKKDRSGLDALSQREFDVLRVLGSGMGIKQCADYLNIGTSTASTYRSRIMEKLNLSNTAELIRFALENELVG